MFETAETGSKVDKETFERVMPELRVELVNAQYDLRESRFPVIVVMDGDDWVGVQSTLLGFTEWMDSRYIAIHAMEEPRNEDEDRPVFWRLWRGLPGNGEIAVFLNPWSTTAVRTRLLGEVDDQGFERILRRIRRFESDQASEGALLLKFWLHLPRKQLKKKIKKANGSGNGKGKNYHRGSWKLSPRAQVLYDHHDEVVHYSQRLIEVTDEAASPWHIIESSDLRFAGLTIGQTVLRALRERLDAPPPTPPPPSNGALTLSDEHSILETVDLSKKLERSEYKKSLDKYQARLFRLTEKAYKKGVSTVLVFEGWDAAGKGGVIRRLVRSTDLRRSRVIPIAAPTDEETAHHYLWRFWRDLPHPGEMAIFDRSWYGRVLVERVEGFAHEEEWRRAYSEINHFEEQLTDAGVVVQKFWLHVDPDVQLERFKEREQTPYKKYKITDDDYRNRERWGDYERAVDEMVARTSTNLAPWHLIPANDKPYARVSVLKKVCDALKERLQEG